MTGETAVSGNSGQDRLKAILIWTPLALVLTAASVLLAANARQFSYEVALEEMPILQLVGLYVLMAGILTVWVPLLVRKIPSHQTSFVLLFIVLIGFCLRLIFLGSPTVLEDDYNRYLWDGAVLAAGGNPFSFSPDEVAEQVAGTTYLQSLRIEAGEVFERINYPQFSTVYPLVAQAVFAATHLVSPFDLDGMRGVLICFELGVLWLVVKILQKIGRSVLWCSLYWWHPVVIKEVANSAHMEPILLLPVLLGVWFAICNRSTLAGILFTIGAGVKIWPLLLLPSALRSQLRRPWWLLATAGTVAAMLVGLLLPILVAGVGENSGFVAFARQWNASSAAYVLAHWAAGLVLPDMFSALVQSGQLARVFLAFGVLSVVCFTFFKTEPGGPVLLKHLFWIVVAIYLLSPSQTPWYFLWVAPFLCFFPVMGLQIAGVLIPLHYLYFHLAVRDLETYYHLGVVWIIWLPVWSVLILQLIGKKRNSANNGEHVRA